MMKFTVNLCGLIWLSVYSVSAWGQNFVPALGDIPLSPQVTMRADATVNFDSTDGRIAEAHGLWHGHREKIVEFYRRTLPALGWQVLADNPQQNGKYVLQFVRANERLYVTLHAPPTRHAIFQLRPLQ